jgi:hypothetical protein
MCMLNISVTQVIKRGDLDYRSQNNKILTTEICYLTTIVSDISQHNCFT